MKVIDLLNKIANGEKVPRIVKHHTLYWEYNEKNKDFKDNEGDWVFSCSNYDLTEMLNDEVEIIEEDKKIEKSDFQTSQIPPWFRNEELIKVINNNFELQTQAIRLLIDEVNKLKENE